MSEEKIYNVPAEVARRAWADDSQYKDMYQRSVKDPDGFWAEQAKTFVTWSKPWTKISDWSYDARNLHIRWFEGAKLNVSYNCLDRHLEKRGNQTAIIWESDDPKVDKKITYRELHAEVCKFANVLKDRGVKKGDRVCIYMPMIPEAAVAMLACARIGAVHSVVFGGFSPESLKDRILDSDCRVVITADEGLRGGKKIPLKANTDQALHALPERAHGPRGQAHRRQHRVERRSRCLVPRADEQGLRRLSRRRRWTPRTRCSSSTPPARPASPRACCTPPAAICCSPR